MAAHNARRNWLSHTAAWLDLPPLPTLSFSPLLTTPAAATTASVRPVLNPRRSSACSGKQSKLTVASLVLSAAAIATMVAVSSSTVGFVPASLWPVTHTACSLDPNGRPPHSPCPSLSRVPPAPAAAATRSTTSAHTGSGPARSLLSESAPRFFLYRMIGNDMPPLQCDGQLFRNTLYTLQHEARDLGDVRRLWVLNNVLNDTEQRRIVHAILSHGYSEQDIIYIRLNYTRLASMPPHAWSNAVTDLNEARNLMMEHGRAHGARWVLPMDGNHFLTREAWAFMAAAAHRHEARGRTVFKIPRVKLDRPQTPGIINGTTLFRDLFPHAPSLHEGMLAFRNDSPHRYLPALGYGRRSKLEAINRICGTGNPYTLQQAVHNLGLTSLLYPDFTPQLADTGECGCQRETGNEEVIRPMSMSVLRSCGVAVRLWYYPCSQVDSRRMIHDGRYRFKQRQKARLLLIGRIRERIKQAMTEQSS